VQVTGGPENVGGNRDPAEGGDTRLDREEDWIRDEIAKALDADGSVLGEVFRGSRDGLSDEETRVVRGAENPNFVWNYKRTIKALLDGDLPSAPSVAAQTAGRFRKLLRTVDFSPLARQRLEERLAILESRTADADAQAAEEKQALAATKAAEQHAEPGIYVYTLPHYIRYPYDPERQHTLLKVGHSGSSVIQRFNAQKRETVLPEEPVLLRVYPVGDATSSDVERRFHALLTAADHLRRDSRAVGREWFLTTTKFLDEIAITLGLPIRTVFDPDSLD
jgi:hypothetical protein